MSLPLLGKGMAVYQGEKMTGAEAMAKAGIKTLDTLVSKEGLGLTNGTVRGPLWVPWRCMIRSAPLSWAMCQLYGL